MQVAGQVFDDLNIAGQPCCMLVGSYARGAVESGDIDILMNSGSGKPREVVCAIKCRLIQQVMCGACAFACGVKRA